jgi:hypothetical protein
MSRMGWSPASPRLAAQFKIWFCLQTKELHAGTLLSANYQVLRTWRTDIFLWVKKDDSVPEVHPSSLQKQKVLLVRPKIPQQLRLVYPSIIHHIHHSSRFFPSMCVLLSFLSNPHVPQSLKQHYHSMKSTRQKRLLLIHYYPMKTPTQRRLLLRTI